MAKKVIYNGNTKNKKGVAMIASPSRLEKGKEYTAYDEIGILGKTKAYHLREVEGLFLADWFNEVA